MAEWLVKCNSSAVRLAGMLHLADLNDDDTPISAETMARAMTVGDYWASHAVQAFELIGVDEVSAGARILLDWITTQGEETVTVRDMYRSHRRRFPRVADAVESINTLIERGWLRPLYDSTLPLRLLVGQRKASPEFAVSPFALVAENGHVGTWVQNVQPSKGSDEVGGVGGEDVPTCTHRTHSVDGEWPSTPDQPLTVDRVGTWVQNAIGNSEVLNIPESDDSGLEAEPRTYCTHVPTQTDSPTDTASAIEADPVDNFDPMDLI
jgi:hypothetical protein